MWNSLVASFIFDQDSIASLIRELSRNKQLRMACGFQPHFYTGKDGVAKLMLSPTATSAYTNFINNLRECRTEIREMFEELVGYMHQNLPEFGKILMTDGKAIRSFASKPSEKNSGHKGEHDEDWCKKIYTTATPQGEVTTKTFKWFGFRLHLLADAIYELPVVFSVTKTSNSEVKETEKMLDEIKEKHPKKTETCGYFPGDKGYDSTELIKWLEKGNLLVSLMLKQYALTFCYIINKIKDCLLMFYVCLSLLECVKSLWQSIGFIIFHKK